MESTLCSSEESVADELRKMCHRCGVCCRNGGPTLHQQDLEIIRQGTFGHEHLVTIRKGEISFSPLRKAYTKTAFEFIKIAGIQGEWTCIFFDPDNNGGCTIYHRRPLECRLFKCWSTGDLLAVIGREVMQRKDLINANDPILDLIREHEEECPWRKVNDLALQIKHGLRVKKSLAELLTIVERDLAIRRHAIETGGLSEKYEMFVFGRPVFLSLPQKGVAVYEENGGILLEKMA